MPAPARAEPTRAPRFPRRRPPGPVRGRGGAPGRPLRGPVALAAGVALLLLAAAGAAPAQDGGGAPGAREVIGLTGVGAAAISPNGRSVAYRVDRTHWRQNRFDFEIWLARRGEPTVQLTRTEGGSSRAARWSPDGRWIAFLARRAGDEAPQLYAIRPDGGEAQPLTSVRGGVEAYAWGPYGLELAVALGERFGEDARRRGRANGGGRGEETEARTRHLWRLDLRAALRVLGGAPRPPDTAAASRPPAGRTAGVGDAPLRRLTGGDSLSVAGFAYGPRAERLAVVLRGAGEGGRRRAGDLSALHLETGEVRPLVRRPGPDRHPVWSPDGEWLLFETAGGRAPDAPASELARVPASGGEPEPLTGGFDARPEAVDWLPEGRGIRFVAWERTRRRLYRLDPGSGEISAVADSPRVVRSVSYSEDGGQVAFVGETARRLPEVYRTPAAEWDPSSLTSMTGQIQGWPVGRQEVVSWRDGDGGTVEGLAIYPPGYMPGRRRPLIVHLRRGLSSVAHPSLAAQYDPGPFPLTRWLERGAVVLVPNHRGSAGYGPAFRQPDGGAPGFGQADDVVSGVRHMVEEGVAHPDSVAAVGWGHGGYLASYLAVTTDRFRAVSVGGAVSDWTGQYVSGELHPALLRALGGTPWQVPDAYDEASPVRHLGGARTPVLVQHGERDARVDVRNARRLFRALDDTGIPAGLVLYPRLGHRLAAPEQRLEATRNTRSWVARWLWGEEGAPPRKE